LIILDYRAPPEGGSLQFILIFFRRKQSVSYDLSRDGWPVLSDHWHPAYVYENRVRIYGGGDEVEMYVS
jgi:hypothetical protein